MLSSNKQNAQLSNQAFAKNYGFEIVDTTNSNYDLLALSFDDTVPKFASNAEKSIIKHQ